MVAVAPAAALALSAGRSVTGTLNPPEGVNAPEQFLQARGTVGHSTKAMSPCTTTHSTSESSNAGSGTSASTCAKAPAKSNSSLTSQPTQSASSPTSPFPCARHWLATAPKMYLLAASLKMQPWLTIRRRSGRSSGQQVWCATTHHPNGAVECIAFTPCCFPRLRQRIACR